MRVPGVSGAAPEGLVPGPRTGTGMRLRTEVVLGGLEWGESQGGVRVAGGGLGCSGVSGPPAEWPGSHPATAAAG